MNNRMTLNCVFAALLLHSSVFAQAPPVTNAPTVTLTSRVRAFSIGPAGEVRSLYLSDGRVVDVAPGLGSQLAAVTQKGIRLTVTGTRAEVKGQVIVAANQIRVNGRRFDATDVDARSAPPAPNPSRPDGPPPLPPLTGPAGGSPPPPPSPMRDPGPCQGPPPPPPPPAQAGVPAGPSAR